MIVMLIASYVELASTPSQNCGFTITADYQERRPVYVVEEESTSADAIEA